MTDTMHERVKEDDECLERTHFRFRLDAEVSLTNDEVARMDPPNLRKSIHFDSNRITYHVYNIYKRRMMG